MSDETFPRPTAGEGPDTPGRPDPPRPGRRTIAELLAQARIDLDRVPPDRLRAEQAAGALVVDIRPVEQRHRDGALPGALVIDRNVLEWRLDPASPDRIPQTDYDRRIIVVCNEGYSSSLAAAALRSLGLHKATDLEHGFQGWWRYCGQDD
jgi:rhodanese-related sulfurtransferase